MEKITNQERLKPWMGIVLFAVVMAAFLTAGVYMQKNWGMTGLVLTEVMFLAIAVGFCLIRKVKLKEVFPVKKVTAREVFGALFLLMSGQGMSYVVTGLVAIIFPAWTSELSELNTFLYSGNAVISFLVVAITPAICEEAIHRGAILSCFRSIKKDWIIVLIMGILFGINHMSPIRFLATAILGGVMSYVVVKRNNIVLSMIMHFANNAFSGLAGLYAAKNAGNVSGPVTINTSVLGVYLLIGYAAPVLFILGWFMISPSTHKKIRFLFAGILSAVMLVSGIVLLTGSHMNNMIVNCQISYTVTEEAPDTDMEFGVEEERTYTVVVVMTGDKDAEYSFTMKDSEGNMLIDAPLNNGSPIRTMTKNISLPVGQYYTQIHAGDGSVGDHPEIQVMVY